jgi:hypothetical protein
MKLGAYRLRSVEDGRTEIVFVIDVDLGGTCTIGALARYVLQSYVKGVVNKHRKFASDRKRNGAQSDAPPLPILNKALAIAAKNGGAKGRALLTNPMFAGLDKGDIIEDGLNIEMGRMIKKAKNPNKPPRPPQP